MDPFKPLSFADTYELCTSTMGDASEKLPDEPLRCIAQTSDGDGFQVVPYASGQRYVGISYTWPNSSWRRRKNSNYTVPIIRDDGSRCESQHVSRFAQAVMRSIQTNPILSDVMFWVDHECVDQNNEEEKQSQVAIMDKIYTKAQFTAILLEDVELSNEELGFLMLNRRKVGDNLETHTRLTRRILAGRWFTRAWCTQEMVLSRGSIIYLHRTEDINNPISFAIGALTGWIATAMIYDRSLTRLTEPRGLNGSAQSTAHSAAQPMHAIAWAYGIVQKMGCYNMYDKVALIQNLVRCPVASRLKRLPDSEGKQDTAAYKNVTKIINMLALLNKDFSLLQTNHVEGNWLQHSSSGGFTWAGEPILDDKVSESWHPKNYEIGMDPNLNISEAGINLKGYAAKVLQVNDWQVFRDNNALRVTVDGVQKLVHSDWLSNDQFTPKSPLSFLRDVLYAIEAFGANDIYPFFLPVQDNWIERDEFVGDLKSDMISRYSRVSSPHEALAQGLRFLQSGRMGLTFINFTAVRFENARPLVLRSNVKTLKGRMLFQPCVMRPKVFGAYLLAANAMVLHGEDFGKEGVAHPCIGNLRSLGLIPDERGLIKIRVC
jgi:hypothetical protein